MSTDPSPASVARAAAGGTETAPISDLALLVAVTLENQWTTILTEEIQDTV